MALTFVAKRFYKCYNTVTIITLSIIENCDKDEMCDFEETDGGGKILPDNFVLNIAMSVTQ